MKPSLEIISIIDNDDGSAKVELEMDLETLKAFASIGLMEVFKSKAMEAAGGHLDSEGEGDTSAGAGGDTAI